MKKTFLALIFVLPQFITATTLKTELSYQHQDCIRKIEKTVTIPDVENSNQIRSSHYESDDIKFETTILSETEEKIVVEIKVQEKIDEKWQVMTQPTLVIARGKSGMVAFGEKKGDEQISELRLVITHIE